MKKIHGKYNDVGVFLKSKEKFITIFKAHANFLKKEFKPNTGGAKFVMSKSWAY